MDPLSALSVAAAVVQFVDFGSRLLADSVAIYHSPNGQVSQHVELATICRDLTELTENIQDRSTTLTQGHNGRPLRPTEQTLVRLCQDCQNISNQLNAVLEHVRADRSSSSNVGLIKDSIATALRTSRSKTQITDLKNSLSDIRQQTMMAGMTVLWEETMSGNTYLDRMAQSQSRMMEILKRIDRGTGTLNPAVVGLSQMETASNDPLTGELAAINTIWSSAWTPTEPITSLMRLANQDTSATSTPLEHDKASTLAIIYSLQFEAFHSRETSIPEAYQNTFKWIFEPPKDGEERADFGQWLRDPQPQMYWITGKPGAGKSTLMKYLMHHTTTKSLLEEWSQPLPLVLASYYFWNAGSSDMQKSQEGLLRTLLFQFLAQMPHLTSKVCPRRWGLFKVFGSKAADVAPKWERDELVECISIFNEIYVGKECRLAVFVDGLDEFDGEYKKLIDLFNTVFTHTGVKVCVSSRPENAFSDAFGENPGLRVQDLTRCDMEVYVKGQFHANRAFLELQQASPGEAEALTKEIVLKSDGVFLWVNLVVRNLLESLTEGDILVIQDLVRVVDEAPKDLFEFYDRIWTRIKPEYIEEFSQLFQIVEAAIEYLKVVTLWLAVKQGPLNFDIKTVTIETRMHIKQLMSRRLRSRTRGLLEVSPTGHVGYLHRSVRDWIMVGTTWADVCSKTPPQFDPNLSLLIATTIISLPHIKHDVNTKEPSESHVYEPINEACLRALIYASNVKDNESNISTLVYCLDIGWAELQFWDYVQAKGGGKFSGLRGYLTDFSGRQSLDNNFRVFSWVCFAAAFGVIPYVRAKLTSAPDILQLQGLGSMSILGCAIFGPDGLSGTLHPVLFADYNHLKRCDLIRFLLQNRAADSPTVYLRKLLMANIPQLPGPKAAKNIRYRDPEYNIWQLYLDVKSDWYPDHRCYLDKIQKVLEDSKELKQWKGPFGFVPRVYLYFT